MTISTIINSRVVGTLRVRTPTGQCWETAPDDSLYSKHIWFATHIWKGSEWKQLFPTLEEDGVTPKFGCESSLIPQEWRLKLAGQIACGMMAADQEQCWLEDTRQLAVNAVAIADEIILAANGELTQEILDAERTEDKQNDGSNDTQL